MEWSRGLEDAWASVASFIPKLAIFAVILFIGWLVAKALSKALGVLLSKLGVERVLDKAGTDRWLDHGQAVGLITKLVYYFVLLIALQLALGAFGPSNPVSQIVDDIVRWLPKAFVAIVIIVVTGAIANAVRDLLSQALSHHSQGDLLARIVAGFIIALGIIAALGQVGIGLSVTLPVLIAVLGTIGGILVVGVGGGLIGPMRDRWERWLGTMEAEAGREGPSRSESPQDGLGTQPPPQF